jgi:predicted DNA-binding transcriptional regulator AlpA
VSPEKQQSDSPPKDSPSQSDPGETAACELREEPAPRAMPRDRSYRNSPSRLGPSAFSFEVLTSAELAQRLKVKESWVIDQSKKGRTHDPIPVFRLGKHRRYRWGSPEMDAWLERRAGNTTQQRKAGPKQKEER